jgi:hypothetical protein
MTTSLLGIHEGGPGQPSGCGLPLAGSSRPCYRGLHPAAAAATYTGTRMPSSPERIGLLKPRTSGDARRSGHRRPRTRSGRSGQKSNSQRRGQHAGHMWRPLGVRLGHSRPPRPARGRTSRTRLGLTSKLVMRVRFSSPAPTAKALATSGQTPAGLRSLHGYPSRAPAATAKLGAVRHSGTAGRPRQRRS